MSRTWRSGRRSRFAAALSACVVLLLVSGTAFSDVAYVGEGEHPVLGEGGLRVDVVPSDALGTVIEFCVGSFERRPVEIAGETYYEIRLTGEPFVAAQGDPALPVVCRSIIIPDGASMEAEILESDFVELSVRVAPSGGLRLRGEAGRPRRCAFSVMYDTPGLHPANPVSLGRPYTLRDFRGIAISVCPFAYDPRAETLRVYTRLVVRISCAGEGTRSALGARTDGETAVSPHAGGYGRAFQEIYEARFLNFPSGRYTPVGEEGRLVVISHGDYLAAIQPYVDWKNQKGIQTDLYDVAAIGSTPEAIRDFIAAQYHAGDGLAFVQLVGDAHQVPTFLTDVIFWDIHGVSDASYALLDGLDTYPEILVGRFSAQTVEQVETQVERTIWYERDIAGGHWLHRAAGLGTVWGEGYGYNGWSGVQSLAVIRGDLLGYEYTEVAELYEEGVPPFGIVPVEAWEVTEVLHDGIGLLNVDGNADTTYLDTGSYTIGHVHALENQYVLPFIFLAAPWCGNFAKNCFAEEWLRATHNTTGEPTGAIAVYTWSNALAYAPPQAAMHEMVDLLVGEEAHTFGGLVYNGACFMMDLYGAPDEYDTFRNANVLGDASLMVRTTYPQEMSVAHEAGILIGQTEFDVSTGVDGALVCLSESGTIIASGYTDGAGHIALVFGPFAAPTSLTLTVTALNRVTSVHTVPVFEGTGLPVDGSLSVTALHAVRPNPTSGPSEIKYFMSRDGYVLIEVYNIVGQRVRTLVRGREPAGAHEVVWDGTDDGGAPVSSGVYFVRMVAGEYVGGRKVAVLRQ